LSVAAFLRSAGGTMLESTGSHGRGVEVSQLTMASCDTSLVVSGGVC